MQGNKSFCRTNREGRCLLVLRDFKNEEMSKIVVEKQ